MTLPSPLAMALGRRLAPLSSSSYTFGVTCHPVGYARPYHLVSITKCYFTGDEETDHKVAVNDRRVKKGARASKHVNHAVATANFDRDQPTELGRLAEFEQCPDRFTRTDRLSI